MKLSDLQDELQLDIGDLPGELLADSATDTGDEYLERALRKTAAYLNRDLGTSFVISGDEVTPDPSEEEKEVYLLRAHAFVCLMMRTVAAQNFSFSSGDKKVDKTKQPQYWEDQEKSLLERYKSWVKKLNPSGALFLDDDVIVISSFPGQRYEIGTIDENGNEIVE
ncbi:MAG: hypothetical protein ACE5GM_10915 [bacterium]